MILQINLEKTHQLGGGSQDYSKVKSAGPLNTSIIKGEFEEELI